MKKVNKKIIGVCGLGFGVLSLLTVNVLKKKAENEINKTYASKYYFETLFSNTLYDVSIRPRKYLKGYTYEDIYHIFETGFKNMIRNEYLYSIDKAPKAQKKIQVKLAEVKSMCVDKTAEICMPPEICSPKDLQELENSESYHEMILTSSKVATAVRNSYDSIIDELENGKFDNLLCR